MIDNNFLGILFGLGLYHGINPAMGWLLASAMGYKKKSRWAVILSLCFLTLGHFAAVGSVLIAFGVLEWYLPIHVLGWITVALLVLFGGYHLWKQSHPTWFGMDVGYPQIALWSFLIATAHGAGLMLIPLVLDKHDMGFALSLIFICVHTAGYILAASVASIILYETMAYAALKKAWINFDLIWAVSLLITAAFFAYFMLYVH